MSVLTCIKETTNKLFNSSEQLSTTKDETLILISRKSSSSDWLFSINVQKVVTNTSGLQNYQSIQTTIHFKIQKLVKEKQDHEKPGKHKPPEESKEKGHVKHLV